MTATSPPDHIDDAGAVTDDPSEDTEGAAPKPPGPPGNGDDRAGPLRPVLWRLHFLGGFVAAPITLWLALTGILIAWCPQIEEAIFGDEREATAEGDPLPVSQQVDAALAVYPDHTVTGVTPSEGPGEATAVALSPADPELDSLGITVGALTAYVDPVDARVLGQMEDGQKPLNWLRDHHSSFRVGSPGTTVDVGPLTFGPLGVGQVTELAASWVFVSLLTGLYLWWPRSVAAMRRTFTLRFWGLRGARRKVWRNLHSSIGLVLFGALTILVATGLTWTEVSGSWVDQVKELMPSESPTLATDLGGGGGEGGAHHGGAAGGHPLDLDDLDVVTDTAVREGLTHPYTITPAAGPGQAWSVAESDLVFPIQETTLAVDPDTGDVVDQLQFSDSTILDQATTLGIGFHQAELFGLFNQILLTVIAVALIGLIITGYVTWWRRRPPGAFAAPPRKGPLLRTVPIPLLLVFGALMVFLPVLGVSFVVYLVCERIVRAVRGPGRTGAGTDGPVPADQSA